MLNCRCCGLIFEWSMFMDLKEFYFQNIKESEYHYRFLESVKKVNYTYNIFCGEEETQNYQFEIYDVEEAITKFKELCQPDVDFSGEKPKIAWNGEKQSISVSFDYFESFNSEFFYKSLDLKF